jgi:hypothetical protein
MRGALRSGGFAIDAFVVRSTTGSLAHAVLLEMHSAPSKPSSVNTGRPGAPNMRSIHALASAGSMRSSPVVRARRSSEMRRSKTPST